MIFEKVNKLRIVNSKIIISGGKKWFTFRLDKAEFKVFGWFVFFFIDMIFILLRPLFDLSNLLLHISQCTLRGDVDVSFVKVNSFWRFELNTRWTRCTTIYNYNHLPEVRTVFFFFFLAVLGRASVYYLMAIVTVTDKTQRGTTLSWQIEFVFHHYRLLAILSLLSPNYMPIDATVILYSIVVHSKMERCYRYSLHRTVRQKRTVKLWKKS